MGTANTITTPHESLTTVMRASGVAGVTWGQYGSPYYQEAVEPPIDFPYVVFDIDPSTIEHTTESPYNEEYSVTIQVVGLEPHVSTVMSPYVQGSVLDFLDSFRNTPSQLSGLNFDVYLFVRESWHLMLHREYRGPTGERVWIAVARYKMLVSYTFLNPSYRNIEAITS